MKAGETVRVTGRFRCEIWRAGQLVDVLEDDNLVVNGGKAVLALLLCGEGQAIHGIGVGTSGAGPTPEDLLLTDQFAKELSGHVCEGPETTFTWSIGYSEANGMTIREFGLLSGDGTLFARRVHPGIAKTPDVSLQGSWTIIF